MAATTTINPTGRRALDMRGVQQKIPLRQTAIRDRIARGEFPQPWKDGKKLWFFEDEIDTWLEARAAQRVSLQPYVRPTKHAEGR